MKAQKGTNPIKSLKILNVFPEHGALQPQAYST